MDNLKVCEVVGVGRCLVDENDKIVCKFSEILDLKRENAELRAQLYEIDLCWLAYLEGVTAEDALNRVRQITRQSPAQSLAEIQAQAIEKALKDANKAGYRWGTMERHILDHANQLREAAK